MNKAWKIGAAAACGFGMFPAVVLAGMPSLPELTDAASLRVQTISFFLLVFFLCAAAVWWLWNSLRGTFPRLPRLSYAKAIALMLLWGLLFLLVLTMIAGARELLTPGAWELAGAIYRLKGTAGK